MCFCKVDKSKCVNTVQERICFLSSLLILPLLAHVAEERAVGLLVGATFEGAQHLVHFVLDLLQVFLSFQKYFCEMQNSDQRSGFPTLKGVKTSDFLTEDPTGCENGFCR